MNHAFKYLYRHDFNETMYPSDPLLFLAQEGGWTVDQVLHMNQSFPELLNLSVPRQLFPKMRFLKETLGVTRPVDLDGVLPPQFFGARLERVLAPRHAFLVWIGLPSGNNLFELRSTTRDATLFQEFLSSSRKPKPFAALCQSWRTRFDATDSPIVGAITAKHVQSFDAIFSRGIMASVRDDLTQHNNTWSMDHLSMLDATSVTQLLIQHGANSRERDHRGASLLHWACGTGNWETAALLLPYCSIADNSTRDASTPLHWAAAGTTAREFGVGGHVDVCFEILSRIPRDLSVRDYVNAVTLDGNSALMWAAWSGSLDTVKLLVRQRADASLSNRNGCTVAHWAASGGNLQVCQYLAEIIQVDFSEPNRGGNTPLTHAVAFGRKDIVEWLLQWLPDAERKEDELLALSLAQDFVAWTNDERRKSVMQAFDVNNVGVDEMRRWDQL